MTETRFNPFRAALRFLNPGDAPGKRTFICYALCDAANQLELPLKLAYLCHEATTAIQNLLGGFATFDGWLHSRCPHLRVPSTKTRIQSTFPAPEIQAWRVQWLEHLAAEYDKGNIILGDDPLVKNPFPEFK